MKKCRPRMRKDIERARQEREEKINKSLVQKMTMDVSYCHLYFSIEREMGRIGLPAINDMLQQYLDGWGLNWVSALIRSSLPDILLGSC